MNAGGTEKIRYLSPPAAVSMHDEWYGIARLTHFWFQRRFEVLSRLADSLIREATAVADVGCGHGLLQRQIEDYYNREVTGFDLNETALAQSVSRMSQLCCYDLVQKIPEYKGRFDLVFLFDVLEHVEDEDCFIEAIQFHMARGGKLLINVPALQSCFSKFDEAVGHIRRYNIDSLRRTAYRNGMRVGAWTYWGLFLIPLLLLRKFLLMARPQDKIVSAGLDSRGRVMNSILLQLSRWEPTPQYLLGSSLMAILESQS